MKLQNLFIIINLLLFVSCKRDVENSNVEVIVNLVMHNDNDLVLYYKDGSNEWFVDEKTVPVSVKGKIESQEVKFKIKLNTIPNDYRLDIGRGNYTAEDTIEIKKFVLKFNDNLFEIKEDEFRKYFRANEFIRYDKISKVYILNKKADGSYDPFFETTMDFYPQLLKLIN